MVRQYKRRSPVRRWYFLSVFDLPTSVIFSLRNRSESPVELRRTVWMLFWLCTKTVRLVFCSSIWFKEVFRMIAVRNFAGSYLISRFTTWRRQRGSASTLTGSYLNNYGDGNVAWFLIKSAPESKIRRDQDRLIFFPYSPAHERHPRYHELDSKPSQSATGTSRA